MATATAPHCTPLVHEVSPVPAADSCSAANIVCLFNRPKLAAGACTADIGGPADTNGDFLVRLAARCCNEPDGQHARCQPRRPSRRHALAVGHLRAVPASHRQRHLRHGSSDGVLMRRAICCDAQPDARNAVARARRSKSQAGADFRPQYMGGHPSLRVADDMISAASCNANPVRRAQRNGSLAFCPCKGAR
jgi:hypothetical protein